MTSTDKQDAAFWSLFERAAALREEGDFPRAIDQAKMALRVADSDARLKAVAARELGLECDLNGDVAGAIAWFELAVQCSPRSELSSLGLYHSYFNAGRLREALEEALRYTESKFGGRYQELFEDAFMDSKEEFRELADRVRANLVRTRADQGSDRA
ncbi:MAG: hypothetical protein KBI14_08140 [Kofleriaceae bacterium]|nr:hypothetical protein [Kofleriaceae bacterium]